MTGLFLVTLFPSCVKAGGELVKNWSFEKRAYGPPYPCGGVFKCQYWTTNKPISHEGGYREVPGDIDGSGKCDWVDQGLLGAAYGSKPGDPNWNPDADLDGSGKVTWEDLGILGMHFGRTANRLDGSYSWYTSGGGDYQMWQWLDSDVVMALAGETVKFSFYFYPESVAPDGSQNNARAEIYYIYNYGQNAGQMNGSWIAPTEIKWYNVYVKVVGLPSTTSDIAVIIHGKPNFKAWVDLAQLITPDYNLYYAWPPYENQGTYPENGYCITWYKYPEFAIAKVCIYADKSTGLVLAYSWDASGIGAEKIAYAKFNMDPPPGNSPEVYEEDDFKIGLYCGFYGKLSVSGAAISSLHIVLYVYYLKLGIGWEQVGQYHWIWDSVYYPNQEIFYDGSISKWISPQKGSGYYAVTAKAYTVAVGGADDVAGNAVSDFYSGWYYIYIDYIKMSD